MKVVDKPRISSLGWKNNQIWLAAVIVAIVGGHEMADWLLPRLLSPILSSAIIAITVSALATWFASTMLAAHRQEHHALHSSLQERDSLQRAMNEMMLELRTTMAQTDVHNKQLRSLGDFNRNIHACESEQQLLDSVKEHLPKFAISDEGALFWQTPENGFDRRAQWPRSSDFVKTIRTGRCEALRNKETVRGCTSCRRMNSGEMLCVPLRAGETTTGMLQLKTSRSFTPDPAQKSILQMAADQLALALRNMNSRINLGDMVMKDSLTGAYNRRYMEEALEREIARCARNSSPLAILMLDLDHFKQLNDTLGHATGDLVLKELAKTLAATVRTSDIVCRYGGEEFLIALPDTSALAARGRADELRRAIHGISKVVRHQRLISASFGVAALPEHASDLKTLMRAADDAMYEAKRTGRDRAVIAKRGVSRVSPPTSASLLAVP